MTKTVYGKGSQLEADILQTALDRLMPVCMDCVKDLALADAKISQVDGEPFQYILVAYTNMMISLKSTLLATLLANWIDESAPLDIRKKIMADAMVESFRQEAYRFNNYLATGMPGTKLVMECRLEGGL